MNTKIFVALLALGVFKLVLSMSLEENREASDLPLLRNLKELLQNWQKAESLDENSENTIQTRGVSSSCLNCICNKESNCRVPSRSDSRCSPGCVWDVNSCSCGYYQIKQIYFTDCSYRYLPINDWVTCANDYQCATQCVKNYMNKYGYHCTRKAESQITCGEYAGLHNGGPRGCNSAATAGYRRDIQNCCNC